MMRRFMAQNTLSDLVAKGAKPADIEAHLDQLSPTARVEEVLAIRGGNLKALFNMVRGAGQLTMKDWVREPEQTYIYELKNNLPLFSVAQKRFFRPREGEVVGYNHQKAFVTFWAGPGYFFAIDGDDGEIIMDYTRLPTLQPEGWPKITPNRLVWPYIVYGNMQDFCRRVSHNTLIGRAHKGGKAQPAYFILTRAAEQS